MDSNGHQEKISLDLLIQSINVEEILNTIEGSNIDNALSNITKSLMQAVSPNWQRGSANLVLEKMNELRKTNMSDEYLRLAYVKARARYNLLLKAEKQQYTQVKEEELIREAEIKPYRALNPKSTKMTPSISLSI